MVTATTRSTRGRLAVQVAGADAVEVKATIAPRQISKALALFGVTLPRAEKRFISFFDTAGLDLFKSGLIARARRIPGRAHDSTIKFRPVRFEDVPAQWHKDKGFKIEADATGRTIVLSASLTRDVPKGLIKRITAGNEPLKALFDSAQEKFVAQISGRRCDFAVLTELGPMDAAWWKIDHPGLPWPFVAELWVRPDGAKTLEASVRVPIAQAAVAEAGFLAFLAELGASPAADQLAKTRWAIEYFSRRRAKSARVKKRAKAS
ncbi:MAG: hypothetical protein ACKVP4_11915 [Hyphomicrobium sp.]